MDITADIPEPIVFNPLKHYLPFIREFLSKHTVDENPVSPKDLIKKLKHLGTCVMDIYTGDLPMNKIFSEVLTFLGSNKISGQEQYKKWTGTNYNSYRIITLSDSSQWTLKYHDHETRYVHIFPARSSPHSFRIKANTLKSALVYLALIGKDFISEDDLNRARAMAGLSPIREVADAEAVTEMIEILRK